jgi:tetratricopeptide (TPR) repeat protein/tRNA A-37 threonylcarbamoyl transferase component Bud32
VTTGEHTSLPTGEHTSLPASGHGPRTTGVVAIDTTGLPPGATFGPTDPSTAATAVPEPATAAPGEGGDATTPGGVLRVGQSFGARYHIIKLLGIGGMGAVYQAWDAELGVAVALKVIRADGRKRARLPEAEKRFKQEINLARQVTHKNVVRIHDLGELDGIKFITMPFVKGEDLSTLLRRELKLPVKRALRLGRQIAAGMQAAHDAGVVHRDLKPPNIMIAAGAEEGTASKGQRGDDEHALIMDFGISASAEEDLSGVIIGTFEYMAPEQASGKAVDARADIYAFGLIVYECLVGLRLSAPLETPLARIEAMKYRVAEGVLPLKTVDHTIPAPLEAIVMKCLERDPANRYATTAELVAALDELDENGNRLPIVRRLTRRMMAAAAVVVVMLLTGTYYTAKWLTAPVKPPDPVSVVIADFQNSTGDAQFDHTIEPQMKRALEDAGFISAYDHNAIRPTFGAAALAADVKTFDEAAAREVAGKQGLGVILSGVLERDGNRYNISMRAIEAVSGKVIVTANGRASGNDKVLAAALNLTPTLRRGLGDRSDSAKMFTAATVSATSPEVLRYYAAARESSSNLQYEEAEKNYAKAVALDPKFGIGYQGLAVVALNQNHLQDAAKFANEALRNIDGMSDRERSTTRGLYAFLTSDYQRCVKEYSEVTARYPTEVLAHNNVGLCYASLRNIPKALEEFGRAAALVPKRPFYRINLALYSNYAGDFAAAERESATLHELKSEHWSLFTLANARVGQGQFAEAASTYEQLAKVNARGASWASSGLGDLAILHGRFSEAAGILERGAADELQAKNPDNAAAKYAALAYAQLQRQNKRGAVAAAEKALANSNTVKIRFLAGRIMVEADDAARARTLIDGLDAETQAEPEAYAKVIEGEAALKAGNALRAIKALNEANTLLDTWIGHFDLGRAYLEAGKFVEADSEFDTCIRRRGEALALFMDEEPTYAFFAPVYYYQGVVREKMNTQGFKDSYRSYLAIRGDSKEDPLVRDVRRKTGN